jgi:hypothetical protein
VEWGLKGRIQGQKKNLLINSNGLVLHNKYKRNKGVGKREEGGIETSEGW